MTKIFVVCAYFVKDHNLIDTAFCDDYEEAADLAVNWQNYYDDEYEWSGDEVIVTIEEKMALVADLKKGDFDD